MSSLSPEQNDDPSVDQTENTRNIEVDENTIDDLNLEERHTTAENVNSMFGVNTFQAENDHSLFSLWKKTDLSGNTEGVDTNNDQTESTQNSDREEEKRTEGVDDQEIPPWMMLGGAVIAAGAIAVLALKKK